METGAAGCSWVQLAGRHRYLTQCQSSCIALQGSGVELALNASNRILQWMACTMPENIMSTLRPILIICRAEAQVAVKRVNFFERWSRREQDWRAWRWTSMACRLGRAPEPLLVDLLTFAFTRQAPVLSPYLFRSVVER